MTTTHVRTPLYLELAPAVVADSEPMADTDTAKALRRTVARLERDLAKRDELIAQLHADGMSNRRIAELAALSHVGVAKLLARLAEDGDADLDA